MRKAAQRFLAQRAKHTETREWKDLAARENAKPAS